MNIHRNPFVVLAGLVAGLALSACMVDTGEESVDESILDESEIDNDAEAYRKPRMTETSCNFRRSDEPCGFGNCEYWYLAITDDQMACGDRICVCDEQP
jgi:hypothetical protein